MKKVHFDGALIFCTLIGSLSLMGDTKKKLSIFAEFSTIDRFLIYAYLIYIYVIPAVSIIAYEILKDEKGLDKTKHYWHLAFFLPIVIHQGFVVNNLRIPKKSFLLAFKVLSTPIGIGIMIFLYGWSTLYATSAIYAFEILGFCIGLFLATIFKISNVSRAHRAVSFLLMLGIVTVIYFRFEWLFKEYIYGDGQSTWHILGGIACLIFASVPNLMTFLGKGEHSVNMGESALSKKTTPVLAISAVFYSFGMPAIIYVLLEA